MSVGRVHYYLFNYAKDHYRIGSGKTLDEACKDAFGCAMSIRYKDMGTRSPKYMTQKAKKGFYGDEGWLKS